MANSENKPEPTKSSFDAVLDLLTGRIGKITALLGAVAALLVMVFDTGKKTIDKITASMTQAPCLVVTQSSIPAKVKYSEWDGTKFKLKGHNSCSSEPGLYVTFLRRSASETRFIVGIPHDDLPQCKGLTPIHEQACWGRKKPVIIGKGDWDWDVLLPPLTRLTNPRGTEKVLITWEVRDMDNPTKPPIFVDSATIEIQNDG